MKLPPTAHTQSYSQQSERSPVRLDHCLVRYTSFNNVFSAEILKKAVFASYFLDPIGLGLEGFIEDVSSSCLYARGEPLIVLLQVERAAQD